MSHTRFTFRCNTCRMRSTHLVVHGERSALVDEHLVARCLGCGEDRRLEDAELGTVLEAGQDLTARAAETLRRRRQEVAR